MKPPSTGWVVFPTNISSGRLVMNKRCLPVKRITRPGFVGAQTSQDTTGTQSHTPDNYLYIVRGGRSVPRRHETAAKRSATANARKSRPGMSGGRPTKKEQRQKGEDSIHSPWGAQIWRDSAIPCDPDPSPVVSTRNTAGGNTTAHIDGGARGDT